MDNKRSPVHHELNDGKEKHLADYKGKGHRHSQYRLGMRVRFDTKGWKSFHQNYEDKGS